jgi:hypothetical protein
MKKHLLVFVMIVVVIASAFPVLASISSGSISGQIIVVAAPEPRKVPVCLVIPADYVAVPIRMVSDQKNSALAYEEVRQASELISQKAKAGGQFRTSTGVISLAQYKSGYGISGGSWSQHAASSEISLLVPLTKERTDIFKAGVEAANFIETLQLPGKVRCESGRLQLAIDNPEQYRAKLLGLIAEEVRKTRDAISTKGSVRVEGLESSVMVRQADDKQVELFLFYSLSITADK